MHLGRHFFCHMTRGYSTEMWAGDSEVAPSLLHEEGKSPLRVGLSQPTPKREGLKIT
jgi:hypothetical protein